MSGFMTSTITTKKRLMSLLRALLWRKLPSSYRSIFQYRFHHRMDVASTVPSAWTTGSTEDDKVLIDRIIAAYKHSAATTVANGESMWRLFFHEYHQEIHNALLHGPRSHVEEILRNPATSDLFYGFDNLSISLLRSQRLEDRYAHAQAFDCLIAFAEAVGVRRLDNPEMYGKRQSSSPNVDEMLNALDSALGVTLPIPNLYPGEFGVVTGRGVLSYRVPQAMYQAWRLRQLTVGLPAPRILEVGAGLGRTAFYAHKLGLTDYTIVDLPITAVAQGYFLGRTLGADRVTLDGEPRRSGAVAIQTPQAFYADVTHYDVVLNADSLTEIDPVAAQDYWTAFQCRADRVLSINHESNSFTVRNLIAASSPNARVTRCPSWMRRGYVEEEVVFV